MRCHDANDRDASLGRIAPRVRRQCSPVVSRSSSDAEQSAAARSRSVPPITVRTAIYLRATRAGPVAGIVANVQSNDLITSYMSYFNFYFEDNRARAWSADEWRFFFDHMRTRLNPGGRVRIELNRGGFYLPDDERGVYLTDATAAGPAGVPGITITAIRNVITLDP